MRIALFSGNYNYLREGANQALNRLVGWLEGTAGHQVRVYSPVTDTPAFEPAGTLVPVPSIALPVRSEFRLATGLPKAIRRNIAQFKPDIVHVSTPDILNTRAQTFAKQIGVPVVASQHTLFETYLDYYRIGWLRPLAEAHLDRFYRRSDHVVTPTETLAAQMRETRGDRRASVWSRGIDRALFDPARRSPDWRRAQGIADHEIAVLFFGRLVLEKGIADYVEAIRRLRAQGLPVRPLVVGEGPGRSAFGPLDDAVLTGHLEGEALARAVASADLFHHPSTTETFGNVVLEGLAAGLPIVAADAPGSRELLDHGAAGVLYAPRDLDAAVAALAGLAADRDSRKAMVKAARNRSGGFSWDAASASVEQVYRDLLGDTRP
ncbi:glycosyltransferase family 4 protein [Croceicoccus naphthovorans]|uniref:Glycosyl transferase family 1 n=1 Tax=Croceicoccus naphthovorans TaxID=1348774 RepID=A0A0G3XER6_9SPHN|nr:glycosyltransferase family 1 protein [Croceicoccus naphthovorans]AKM09692.1 glycosyl transferase family 1 [Croceicoccus naphthovorans]MBB3990823.1 glycosyltransferase involved in cell wall biosynthesis [Croceicoccus naphthovorans]